MNVQTNRPLNRFEAQMQKSPRLFGAQVIGLAILLLAINGVTLSWMHLFYPSVLFGAAATFAMGAWMVAVGRPTNAETGKAPLWWHAGSIVLVVAAVGGAIVLSEWLKGA
ncbi:MAG TPA: hypothetical protein VGI39_28445 [Polyangiaceae bacterium]|jgi:hypothetical protein